MMLQHITSFSWWGLCMNFMKCSTPVQKRASCVMCYMISTECLTAFPQDKHDWQMHGQMQNGARNPIEIPCAKMDRVIV